MMRYLLAAALCAGVADAAFAGPLNSFDNVGDTAGFTPDRYPPASFMSGQSGGGRTGTLLMSLSATAGPGSRPSNFSSSFYNTQGMQAALPAGTSSLFVDLYVPSSYQGLNQNVPGAEGRLASLWGVGTDGSAVSAYPIIEFNNNRDASSSDGFRTYNSDTGTWTNVAGFNGYDQWYQIGFDYSNGVFTYFVNGQAVSNFSEGTTTSLSNVILQGYNAGNSYNINFDNLTTTAVPEPASMAVFGALGLVAVGARLRRKTAVA